MKKPTIAVTGAAGFIGSSLSKYLIRKGHHVIGIDNLTPNYPLKYKKANLNSLLADSQFHFHKLDIRKQIEVKEILHCYHPQILIHLAAMTGVRASLIKPKLYESVNTKGALSVYKAALESNIKQFIFSSSSSIYGNNPKIPFSESNTPDPRSPYAKSKWIAEQELKVISNSKLPITILRFFSVYGPHGRPDMSPFLFTQAAYSHKSINQYGSGNSARDYTYIEDVVSAIYKVITNNIKGDTLNVGNSYPIELRALVKTIEKLTQQKIMINKRPERIEESHITWANISKINKLVNWRPKTSFAEGMKQFVIWYKQNYYDKKS